MAPFSRRHPKPSSLRHTAINHWRIQRNDFFRIIAANGHQTLEIFKRYNSGSRADLKRLAEEKPLPLDTNMDTKGSCRGRGIC
jgi:hypothetical protein